MRGLKAAIDPNTDIYVVIKSAQEQTCLPLGEAAMSVACEYARLRFCRMVRAEVVAKKGIIGLAVDEWMPLEQG